MTPARVVVVDDHPIVLRGVADMIGDAPEFEVVGTAQDARQALQKAETTRPDLILLDLRLKDDLATDLIGLLKEQAPGARIVILTAYDDGEAIRECLKRGASGVLLKDASTLDLVRALRSILGGARVVDPRLTGRERRDARDEDYIEGGYQRLSERELEVLRLLARGLSTREMAAELALKPNTIRSYTQSILEKLQANNRVMALANARRLRLI
ncbi:response regulator transcription factor [Prosthecomicrobium sp. N25]|uniref:response regulator transcription factor n=1 Tax=Prosthecomicrobium sp. N25 TaxID=3129254 RepID=UPI0030788142